ncbi:hypothetical protein BJI55_12965 [Acinetobacter pittii]|nr:hypothetical protein BJI55_12965 [Acinetobacter pittii]
MQDMLKQHEIIKKVGGLNKVKDLFQKLALDDVYCEETGKWYSGRYWQENMKGKTGILFDQVVSAFMLSDIIIYIGGTFSGELTYFNYEREIRRYCLWKVLKLQIMINTVNMQH